MEESNFHINSVKTRVIIPGKEAGWIVNVSEVLGHEDVDGK